MKKFLKRLTLSVLLAFLITSLETAYAQEEGNKWGGVGTYQENWTPDVPHKLIQKALEKGETIGLRIGPPVDLSSEVEKTAVVAFEGSMLTSNEKFSENKNHIPIWMNVNDKTFWDLFQNSFNLVYISDGTIYSIENLPKLLQAILTKDGKAVIMYRLTLQTPNPLFIKHKMYADGGMPNSWHDENFELKMPENFESEIERGADEGPNPNVKTGAANTAILWVPEEKFNELSKKWSDNSNSEEVQDYLKEMRSQIIETWSPYFNNIKMIDFSDENRPSYTDHDVKQERSPDKHSKSVYGYLIISDPKKE